VIKFVSDLRQVWFSPGTPVFSNNKTDRHDITEILLKRALTTINNQPIFNKEMESLSKVLTGILFFGAFFFRIFQQE
jgi:hypothetical protein